MRNQLSDRIDSSDNIILSSNNELWHIMDAESWNKRIPIHGHLELTPRCNLDCKMCYVHLNREQLQDTDELLLSDWKKIINQAVEEGMIFVSLTGGECLTSPFFDELYTFLNSKGLIIFVLTNGVLLSDKFSLFQKYPPALIQVSMYGYDEDSYERVTGKRYYKRVSETILLAKEYGLNISVAVTTSKLLPSVYKIVKKYFDLGISVAVNKWLIPPNSNTGRDIDGLCLSPEEQVEISKEILLATGENDIQKYQGELPSKNNTFMGKRAGLTCTAGRNSFGINWRGEMVLCASINEIIGKPLETGFHNVWKKAVKMADSYLVPVECFDCAYKKVCNSCPAHHSIKGEKGHCNPDICEEGVMLVKNGIKQMS